MFIHKANLHLPLSFEALEEVVVRRFIHIICKDSEIKKSSVYYTIRNLSEQSEKSKNKEIKKTPSAYHYHYHFFLKLK